MRTFSNLIERLRFLFLFFVLLLFCFTKALDAQFGLWRLGDVIFSVLIIYSLIIIGDRSRRLLQVLIVLAIIEGIFLLLSFLFDYPLLGVIKAFFTMLYFALMTAVCLRYTFADKTIDITTLFGSLSAYLFIGLAYAYLYLCIGLLDYNAFSGLNISYETDLIYFSFVTLTTVGYGDVVPRTPIAQTFSWMESFAGQAYLAIIMAQLVGRYMADKLRS
ncbi:potassium channel family protein [Legionella clemsonensis]|uniref:Voltage-gated potassium channel n=1 Tax=Legionella clemsonensis TaxID=1867846 RepID=A0A222P475_9GAMM|nr:potassium channel family protein [Legionella clemsonensis]ASQ46654.1 voltage-gated potassium channel [Legionella clemsonensis]